MGHIIDKSAKITSLNQVERVSLRWDIIECYIVKFLLLYKCVHQISDRDDWLLK